MSHLLGRIGEIYRHEVVDAGDQPHLIILASFLLTFLAVRLITHAIRSGRTRFLRNLSAGGTHIHHLVWGILLLMGTGYAAIAFQPAGDRELLALLFGVGAALTMDEFALWLNLEDVYWTEKGRRSIDAVIITTAILAIFTFGFGFWIALARELLIGVFLPT